MKTPSRHPEPMSNYYTGLVTRRGTKARALVAKQSVFSLVAESSRKMSELLARHGFHPRLLSAPVFDAAGNRPSHDTDPAATFAEMALLVASNFTEAWTQKHFHRAAEFAFLCGDYSAKAYMHDRKASGSQKGKAAVSSNAAKRNADYVRAALAKCEEKRGHCSVKEIHDWLGVRISLQRYHAILKAANFAQERKKIREKFLAKR